MPLRENDLVNTMFKDISIDEFEPKTGDTKDVLVLGFYLNENLSGKDLYSYLNNSIIEIRDVEVSPNPNPEGRFMVFLEMDRKIDIYNNVKDVVKEVERLSGKLNWQISTLLSEENLEFNEDNFNRFVQTDPDNYLSPEEWRTQKVESEQKAEEDRIEEEAQDKSNRILEFLKATNILEAGINEGTLHMRGSRDIASFKVIDFGNSNDIMEQLGINESAIKLDFDKVRLSKLNAMLGEVKAIPIDEYIIMYNPSHKDILVTQVV
ncbi:hypothetical protein N9N08_00300 [bacterium]|jgi:hypothetical protein|nr:hypothetical protein [bacterium]